MGRTIVVHSRALHEAASSFMAQPQCSSSHARHRAACASRAAKLVYAPRRLPSSMPNMGLARFLWSESSRECSRQPLEIVALCIQESPIIRQPLAKLENAQFQELVINCFIDIPTS